MYISKLKIKNYRNFNQFEIDLQPFSIIIGENNTGKTNMLEAIGLIFSQEITFFKKRILEKDDINYFAIQDFKKQVSDTNKPIEEIEFPQVLIEATLKDFDEDQEAIVGDWFQDSQLEEAKISYAFQLSSAWQKKDEWLVEQREKAGNGERLEEIDFPIHKYEYSIFPSNSPTSASGRESYFLRMFKMEFLDAFRDARRELVANGDYKLLYKILTNRDEGKFEDIRDALISLNEKLDSHSELKSIEKSIKEYLDKISLQENDEDNSVSFKFSSPETSEILKKLGLLYGMEPINIERNGLGRNNLLFISLVLSHIADKSYQKDDIYFRILGIEEPEAHLHPHLQMHLAKNIKNEARSNLQILLTTHSSYIASKLDIKNTIILYKEGHEIKKHPVLEGMGTSADAIKSINYLKKYLDATNSIFLFAKKVILVEGISEELLIPKLYEIYSQQFAGTENTDDEVESADNKVPTAEEAQRSQSVEIEPQEDEDSKVLVSLEKIGCNVVNVNGLAFKHFLKIVKNGYFIRCAVFTDSDTGTKVENRADNLRREYGEGNDIIKVLNTNLSTFEKDLIDANKSGDGKRILLKALNKTKSQNGPIFQEATGASDIDINGFFSEIEKYKSEFSLSLLETLSEDSNGFVIPQYILTGFEHINPHA